MTNLTLNTRVKFELSNLNRAMEGTVVAIENKFMVTVESEGQTFNLYTGVDFFEAIEEEVAEEITEIEEVANIATEAGLEVDFTEENTLVITTFDNEIWVEIGEYNDQAYYNMNVVNLGLLAQAKRTGDDELIEKRMNANEKTYKRFATLVKNLNKFI